MKGSSRVQAASEECLSLSACGGRSGCGAAGERRERRERRGEAEIGVYAAATLIQDSHHHITFSPLNQPKTL